MKRHSDGGAGIPRFGRTGDGLDPIFRCTDGRVSQWKGERANSSYVPLAMRFDAVFPIYWCTRT